MSVRLPRGTSSRREEISSSMTGRAKAFDLANFVGNTFGERDAARAHAGDQDAFGAAVFSMIWNAMRVSARRIAPSSMISAFFFCNR